MRMIRTIIAIIQRIRCQRTNSSTSYTSSNYLPHAGAFLLLSTDIAIIRTLVFIMTLLI